MENQILREIKKIMVIVKKYEKSKRHLTLQNNLVNFFQKLGFDSEKEHQTKYLH